MVKEEYLLVTEKINAMKKIFILSLLLWCSYRTMAQDTTTVQLPEYEYAIAEVLFRIDPTLIIYYENRKVEDFEKIYNIYIDSNPIILSQQLILLFKYMDKQGFHLISSQAYSLTEYQRGGEKYIFSKLKKEK